MERHADIKWLANDTEWYHPYKLGLMSHAETKGPKRFVRYVEVVPPKLLMARQPWQKLSRVLAIADRELDICARACGAEVVPHTWGRVHGRWGDLAVAEVDRVIQYCDIGLDYGDLHQDFDYDSLESMRDPDNLPPMIRDNLHKGLRNYNRIYKSLRPTQLYDLDSARQFVYGFNLNDPEQVAPKLFLVDIEPVFGPKQWGM